MALALLLPCMYSWICCCILTCIVFMCLLSSALKLMMELVIWMSHLVQGRISRYAVFVVEDV